MEALIRAAAAAVMFVSEGLDPAYLMSDLPAAAAASRGFFLSPDAGLKGDFTAMGLRLRRASEALLGGDLDLLSNRERLISGSIWSKRDRLVLLRSSSAILEVK